MPILDWVALFKDKKGIVHTYRQPSDDPVEGFPRVLEEEKQGNLVSFFLDFTAQKRSIGVNLITGHFIFSGYYNYHPAPNIVDFNPTYRLINFRRMRKDYGTGLAGTDKEGESWTWGQWLAYYILGWQTTIEGINYQRMMFIDPNTLEFTIKEKR